MRFFVLYTIFIFISLSALTQESELYKILDTIYAESRKGGKRLDSIDLIFSEKYITSAGSFNSNIFGKNGNDYKIFLTSLSKQTRELDAIIYKYSALPYLGTSYAFGSKGTQYLDVCYHQSFTSNLHFSLFYKRNTSSGAYRYNSYLRNQFTIGALYQGDKWLHQINIATLNQDRNLNGGISSYNEIELYGLEYAKVNKEKSSDSIAKFNLQTESEWRFLKRDSLNYLAFVINNKLSIDKRVFIEQDSLIKNYPNIILFDIFNTRDLTQLSRIDHQLGFRYRKKNVRTEIFLNKGFWKYKTASFQFKNELDFHTNVYLKKNSWSIISLNQINIIGANQQTKFDLQVIQKSEKIDYNLTFEQHNLLPKPYQRIYITNTLNYVTSNLQLQHTQSLKFELNTKTKNNFSFLAYFANFKNQYYYLNNRWRNDTLESISQLSLQFKANFSFGVFCFQPNLTFNLIDKVQILPKYDFRARVFITKNFKRPGTRFQVGTDLNYMSTYRLMTFDERISLYQFNLNNGYYLDYLIFDAFVSMQLDEFKMYFKLENIDNLISTRQNYIAKNYPTSPLIMRLGITWDFFN